MDTPHSHRGIEGPGVGNGEHAADHYGRREPNAALLDVVSDMAPGRAVDLGCGTGAEAIWLASHGWTVTGIDISQAAIDQATEACEESGVTVDWICADFVDQPPSKRSFDLVTAFYPALLKSDGRDAVDALVRGVVEGGTLLVVGHGRKAREAALSKGYDPSGFMEPQDIAAHLDSTDWDLRLSTSEVPHGGLSPRLLGGNDVIFRANRRPTHT